MTYYIGALMTEGFRKHNENTGKIMILCTFLLFSEKDCITNSHAL